MKLFKKKILYLLMVVSVFILHTNALANVENYIYSAPINNMSMYDTRYNGRGILMIGDEKLNLFKQNVSMGFDYIIEEKATLAKLKYRLKDIKDFHPTVVIFSIGLYDYLENTSIKEFKDTILEYRDKIRYECNVDIAFLSYLDYNEYNGNTHNYEDYDKALIDLARTESGIKYIDIRYASSKTMLDYDDNYNKELLFYEKYALINFINEMNGGETKVVFVGDSRTVGLSIVNKEKNMEFIGVPAGKFLEFHKTMELIIKKFYRNCKVVILYGINDIEENGETHVDDYINYLNAFHNDFFSRGIELYIASVMEQKDLENIITFPRNYTLYARNSVLNYLDGHIHTIDLYTYMFVITTNLGKDEVFADEIHFTDSASKLILDYLYDNII